MESSGLSGRIRISESTRLELGSDYECEPRGFIEVKGLGQRRSAHDLSCIPGRSNAAIGNCQKSL
ncbi:MAG: hypothetical protein ACO3FQ_00030 [Terrimicrobiaceae bacterium]